MLLKQKVQYGIFETYFVGMEETLSTTTRKTPVVAFLTF